MTREHDILARAQQLAAAGQGQQAFALYSTALKTYADNPNVYFAFGQFLLQCQQLDMAEKVLFMGQKLAGETLTGLHLLGQLCLLRHQKNQAEIYYTKANTLKGQTREHRLAYAHFLRKVRRFDEASVVYNNLLQQFPHDYDVVFAVAQMANYDQNNAPECQKILLAHLPFLSNPLEHVNLLASSYFEQMQWPQLQHLTTVDLPTQCRLCVLVYATIYQWLSTGITQLPPLLLQPLQVQGMAQFKRLTSVEVFRRMLVDLTHADAAAHRTRHTGNNTPAALHIIGDSHVLPAANVQMSAEKWVQAWLVMGLKAYHLAQEGENMFKAQFAAKLQKMPAEATVVVSAGEIDCRVDEGFLPYLTHNPQLNKQAYVADVAQKYVLSVLAMVGERRKTLFWGVPAPMQQVAGASASQTQQQVTLIRWFNAALAQTVAEQQSAGRSVGFIDVYAATTGANGVSHGQAHFDNFHLKTELYTNLLFPLDF